MVKRELCGSRHREMVQEQVEVNDSPEGAQQQGSPAQLRQGDHLPAAQQPQGGDDVHTQLQRQTACGGTAPNMGLQQMDEGWEAPEVIVQVRPQKLCGGWESPEVTVQVQPQKPSSRWEAPLVTVQVQLQQRGQGSALPQVTVQVRPQEWRQGTAGIKVTVQLGCEPQEITCPQDQSEEVLGDGEQLTPKQNRGEPMASSEGDRELTVVELVPQGAPSQQQDQGGVMTKPQQDQSQAKDRAEVVELQDMRVGGKADLEGMVTEDRLQDQSREQEQLKADLAPQQEDQRATEMKQEQCNVQEGPREMVEGQKEDLGQEVSKKCPRKSPNYFVAVPVRDDQVFQSSCSIKTIKMLNKKRSTSLKFL